MHDLYVNILLPYFLSQVNAFIVDCQMIMAPEALATFFTLVCLLTCNKHGLVKVTRFPLYCNEEQNEIWVKETNQRNVLYCTRVYFLMFGQVIMAYEGFSTFITLVAFIVMVDSEVEPVQETAWSESL